MRYEFHEQCLYSGDLEISVFVIVACSFVLFALHWLSINTTKVTKALSTRLLEVVFVVFVAIKNFDLWLYTLIYERFHKNYENLVLALRSERVMYSCISSCDLQGRVYLLVITFSRHQIRQTFQSCIIWPHRDSGSTLAIYCVATWIMQSHAITYAWLWWGINGFVTLSKFTD